MTKSYEERLKNLPYMTAYLTLKNAHEAIEFYKNAFGAEVLIKLIGKENEVVHSELGIGNIYFGVSEQSDAWGNATPDMLGGSPVLLSLEVEDVDAFAERAIKAGAEITEPIEEQFYGARSGRIKDPYGFHWMISTTTVVMSQEEMQAAMMEWMDSLEKS